ncbi:MAG: hypothetical protein LBG96_06855 [Tannerella sp.]|nr:hypothetical protein [Tannerella sp.]
MFKHGHRSFLMLGGGSPADIISRLTERGHEIAHYSFSFQQGVDANGKATTRVY